jgi:hypothetical protein
VLLGNVEGLRCTPGACGTPGRIPVGVLCHMRFFHHKMQHFFWPQDALGLGKGIGVRRPSNPFRVGVYNGRRGVVEPWGGCPRDGRISSVLFLQRTEALHNLFVQRPQLAPTQHQDAPALVGMKEERKEEEDEEERNGECHISTNSRPHQHIAHDSPDHVANLVDQRRSLPLPNIRMLQHSSG